MKELSCFLFLFSFSIYAQTEGKVKLTGRLTGNVAAIKPFSCGIYFDFPDTQDFESIYTYADSVGLFKKELPKNTKVKLRSHFEDHYSLDTTFYTGSCENLEISLKLSPKIYTYSKVTALDAIKRNDIQLVTNDTLLYNWNQKIHYTNKFGFTYVLKAYEDLEFRNNTDYYNYKIKEHLVIINKNDSLWYEKLLTIEDSLTHLKADNYCKKHKIRLSRLKVPPYRTLPLKMQKAIEEQKSEFERLHIKTISIKPPEVLAHIDADKEYGHIFDAEYWMAYNYAAMIPELIRRITNTTEVGLVNTADLIIWERVESGDLKFYGHGGIAFDDLFTVAGRANHLLTNITGEDFGRVSMYSTDADLKKLQNRWAYWLLRLQAKP